MSVRPTQGSRVDWVDFGKGFSIIMVVLHHAMAEEPGTPFSSGFFQTLDEYFIFLRMPVFFLMAGIFAAKALREPWPDFIDKKLLNFFYLFVVWALLLYALTIAIPYYGWNVPTKRLNAVFNLFTSPPVTLWFIYALMWMFLITRLLKWVPLWLLTLGAFAACLAFLNPEILSNKPFPQKMIRLYPFFLLGCLLSPWLQRVSVYLRPWHLLLIPVYGWFCWALLHKWGLKSVTLVVLCQVVGAATGVIIAEMLSRAPKTFAFVKVVGVYSLAVYVMHRLVIFALEQIAPFFAFSSVELNVMIAWVVSIIVPIYFAKWVARKDIHGIFDRPRWLSVRREKKAPALMVEAPAKPEFETRL